MDIKHDSRNPYEQYAGDELILRDQLAIDRTVLANERTMLSYARTGLALALSGAGCIQIYRTATGLIIGLVLIVLGAIVAAIGFQRYFSMKKIISTAGSKPSSS